MNAGRKKRPRKALVLAAGFGTRMLPLSRDLPKALMPLWGKPMLGNVLDLLASWGVEEAVVNAHHLPEQVLEYVRGRTSTAPRINLSFEPEILGTGGALRKVEWFLDEDPFWLVNADIAMDVSPDRLWRRFGKGDVLATLWMHPSSGPRTVEMEGDRITNFRSRRPGTERTFTFTGLHLISPQLLKFIPRDGFSTIVGSYERALRKGQQLAGVTVPGAFWADVGTPNQYLSAHREILARYHAGEPGAALLDPAALTRSRRLERQGVRVSGFACVADEVEAEDGVELRDVVVWEGARLHAGSCAVDAIVGRGVHVFRSVRHVATRSECALDGEEAAILKRLKFPPGHTTANLLGVRGSGRSFTRLSHRKRSVMLVRYDPAREENLLYAGHARFLGRLGLRVPGVLHDDPENHRTFFEDLGDQTLEDMACTVSAKRLLSIYRRVLDAARVLHTDGTREARRQRLRLAEPFSVEFYEGENTLFIDHMLVGRLRLGPKHVRAIRLEMREAFAPLLRARPALVHRDLQSSNVLMSKGTPGLIDFQGMRIGAAAYDLASLLCDPYVSLPLRAQQELLAYYSHGTETEDEDLRRTFWYAAVQRLTQALGAYARLSAIPGMESFARHIEPAADMLLRALDRLDGFPRTRRVVEIVKSQ